MATILRANGTEETVEPKNGRDFKLRELQEIVGGYIEVVYLENGQLLVVHDEGALIPLPINAKATAMYQTWNIHGDVLLCERKQIK